MKLFELYRQPLTEDQRFQKWNTILESSMALLESLQLDVDWEPQPEFQGAKGKSTNSSFGIKSAKDANVKLKQAKVNKHWNHLTSQINTKSGEDKHKYIQGLEKYATRAAEMGFTIAPSLANVLTNLRSM